MKATGEQKRRRVEEVLKIRLDGAEIWDVREYVREKEQEKGSLWELPPDGKPLSDSQLWRYMADADKLIAESCRASRKKLIRRHLAQRRNLFAKAVSAGDYRTGLAIGKDKAELEGLYPPQKVAPTNPDGTKPFEGKVTHDIAGDFFPYADALRVVLSHSGTVPPDGPAKPVDPP